jgi:hypothetical protein
MELLSNTLLHTAHYASGALTSPVPEHHKGKWNTNNFCSLILTAHVVVSPCKISLSLDLCNKCSHLGWCWRQRFTWQFNSSCSCAWTLFKQPYLSHWYIIKCIKYQFNAIRDQSLIQRIQLKEWYENNHYLFFPHTFNKSTYYWNSTTGSRQWIQVSVVKQKILNIMTKRHDEALP